MQKGEQQAYEVYAKDQSLTRAKFAGAGGKLEGASWDAAIGQNVTRRDERLADVKQSRKEWEGSEGYKLIREEYDKISNPDRFAFYGNPAGQRDTTNYSFSGESRVGESLWGAEQQAQVMSYSEKTTQRNAFDQERTMGASYQ